MILTGRAITAAVRDGDVVIEPFTESQVNPNSYNLWGTKMPLRRLSWAFTRCAHTR